MEVVAAQSLLFASFGVRSRTHRRLVIYVVWDMAGFKQ